VKFAFVKSGKIAEFRVCSAMQMQCNGNRYYTAREFAKIFEFDGYRVARADDKVGDSIKSEEYTHV
jgi:hypothetical protein